MQQNQSKKYKYFISGGGTGGHIYPAVTVAEELLKESDTEKIFFIGNPSNLEYQIIKNKKDITFLPVKISGMPRNFTFKFIKWLWDLNIATWKSLFYVLKYRPDAIFTTGGYVSAPVAFAAIMLRKKFMIHDCDTHPGLVSRYIAPFASIVSVAFEKAKSLLDSKNIILNGNPIRSSFSEYSKEKARELLNLENKSTIAIMGGSQGSNTINDAIVEIAKYLVEDLNLQIVMQTGNKNYENVANKLYEVWPEYENNKNIIVRPYFDEMAIPLKASDIVVSRAGSLSLSEISICSLPSILVPYPYAAADHQRKNAKEMVDIGASLYIEDDKCTPEVLLNIIKSLITNPQKMIDMSSAAASLSTAEASKNIIKQLKSIIK